MTNPDFTPPLSPFGDDVLETAYYNVESELLELRPEELLNINLDIIAAVNTAAGVIPEVKVLRDQIVEQLPKFNLAAFDKLHHYAMAAAYAHTVHLATAEPQDKLRPIFEEAIVLRDVLLSDATTLAKRGHINGLALNELKRATGFKNVQSDLQMLVNILKSNWPNIAGKCGTTEAELARAEKLVSWLIQSVGLREQGPAEVAKTADLRTRAFTLFTKTYNDVRRAVAYLRWNEGDVDTIIPSLYAGRGGRKKDTTGAASSDTAPPPTATVVPNGPPSVTGGLATPATNDGGPFVS